MNGDERAEQILAAASRVFFEKGFDRATIRDVAKAADMSLAGLYYHFPSKEDLLHRIQERVFGDLLETARERLDKREEPVERLEAFIHNHLSYFLANLEEMKVLSHEYRRLAGEEYQELVALRHEYYDIAREIVGEITGADATAVRVRTLGLFGMLNWLYTWYRPDVDPGPDELAAELTQVYIHGLLSTATSGSGQAGRGEHKSR